MSVLHLRDLALYDLALASDGELAAFFLDRLASLAARQLAATSPTERAALGVATFSVFLDCLDLGLAAEARAILGHPGLAARRGP